MSEPLLLRVEEVAERLRLSRSKTYELIASGQIPSITIGSARRVPAAGLAAWIRRLASASSGAESDPSSATVLDRTNE